MSDPVPPLPPGDPSAGSRISDRAALEAAIIGAAGLLLGRVLLGRRLGWLAGSAAIAARLLTDATAKKSPPDSDTVPPPPEPPAPGDLTAAPAVVPETAAFAIAPALQPTDVWARENPFANLFAESPPNVSEAGPAVVSPAPAELSTDRFSPPVPEVADHLAEPDLPLPAFPALKEVLTAEKEPVTKPDPEPSPASTPLPGLSDFPDLTAALPNPNGIWKMAAAESVPELLENVEVAPSPAENPLVPVAATGLVPEPSPAFPISLVFPIPSGTSPAMAPEPVIDVRDDALGPLPALIANHPALSLDVEPVPAPEADLPLDPALTLEVVSPPVFSLKVGSPDPEEMPATPRRAAKAWIAITLLAMVLAWIFRHEITKAFQAPSGSPPPPASVLLPQPPVVPPPPAPTPLPPPITPPAPPIPSPPEKETAVVSTPPPSSLATPPQDAEPLPGVLQDFPPASLEARSRQVLEQLLEAASTKEARPLIYDADPALKQAALWYPDGKLNPSPWKRIIFDSCDPLPRSPYKASFFRVVTDAIPMGFPVAVEDTKEGPRIDLNAFLQCRDSLLDAFISSPRKPARPFFVILRRGHYFGDDLSPAELEKLICFEAASPNPGSAKHRVFIERGSDLGQLAVKKFVWEESYTPVVELTHAGKVVEITAILRDVWRNSPTP